MTLNQTDRQLITTRNEGITGIQLLKIDIDTNWKYPVLYNFGWYNLFASKYPFCEYILEYILRRNNPLKIYHNPSNTGITTWSFLSSCSLAYKTKMV